MVGLRLFLSPNPGGTASRWQNHHFARRVVLRRRAPGRADVALRPSPGTRPRSWRSPGSSRRVPADALALALAAAALHAGWNVLIARAGDPEGAGAAAILFAVVVFAPVAALTWERATGRRCPYMAVSAAAELVYFALLAAAYRRSEMSLVYPIARGLAPVLVLVAAAVATSAEPSARRDRRASSPWRPACCSSAASAGAATSVATGDGDLHRRHDRLSTRSSTRAACSMQPRSRTSRSCSPPRASSTRPRSRSSAGPGVIRRRLLALVGGGRPGDVRGLRARAGRPAAGAGRVGRRGARDERRHGDRPRRRLPARARHPRARPSGRCSCAWASSRSPSHERRRSRSSRPTRSAAWPPATTSCAP